MDPEDPRVLIVDDEPQVALLIRKELSENGFTCRVAENADRAKSLIDSQLPDVLIADIQMPRTSGLELLAYVRNHVPHCRAVLITGHPKRQYVAQALLQGAYDYIEKPFRPGQLVETVSRAVAEEQDLPALVDRAVTALESGSQARQASLDAVTALVRAVEAKDPYTRRHSEQVAHYRNETLGLPISAKTGRSISSRTAYGRLKTVVALIRWAYRMHLLEHMPRNIDTLSKMPRNGNGGQPEVRIFSAEELKLIWEKAPSRVRCFIALAINCGYGQKDLSDLRHGDIDWEDGYIERIRVKTGVRSRHKLWQITLDLVRKHKSDGVEAENRVFLTQNGFPLVRSFFADGKAGASDAVHNAFWRVLRKVGLADGRGFYCLRKTGATLIEAIDPDVTGMYLTHAEPGMKRVYAQRDWKRLARALVKLEKRIDLKL